MSQKLSYAQSTDEALPDGWFWSTLGEVADVLAGNPAPQGDEFFTDGQYPFVRVQDMGRLRGATKINATNDYINDKAAKGLRLFPKGSVLFTKSGASTLLNQRAMLGSDMYVVSHIAAAISKDGILSEWLYYWLQTVDFAHLAHATTLPSLPLSKAKEIPIPVAPLDQQKRIVEEIEKQFSRLDEATANLKRVQANLKRYKASVLKAAVEGKLVEIEAEIARREGRSYETGEELLQRILKERREKWSGRSKYKEPAAPDVSNLPKLPEGWVWGTPDQLAMSDDNAICAGPFGTIFKAKDFRDTGVPIIFLRHVSPGQYLTHKPGFMDEQKWKELFQAYSVYGGELLITKLGEPPGVCAIYPVGIGPAMVTPDVIKMSVDVKIALSSYLMFYFNSEIARKFSSGVAFGTTRTRLTIPIFREMPVAVPPLAEQHRIVAEVDSRLSLLREAEAQVDANLQRAERLRQSVLKRAFTVSSVSNNLRSAR